MHFFVLSGIFLFNICYICSNECNPSYLFYSIQAISSRGYDGYAYDDANASLRCSRYSFRIILCRKHRVFHPAKNIILLTEKL